MDFRVPEPEREISDEDSATVREAVNEISGEARDAYGVTAPHER